jgi:hypothetical protein
MDEFDDEEKWVDGFGNPTAPPEAIGKNPPRTLITTPCPCGDSGCQFEYLMDYLGAPE